MSNLVPRSFGKEAAAITVLTSAPSHQRPRSQQLGMRPQKRTYSASAASAPGDGLNFKARKLLELSELASMHRHSRLRAQDAEGQLLDVKDSMMSRSEEKAVHKPMWLDSVSSQALQVTMYRKKDLGWHVNPLPVFAEDKRTLAKFRAPSSVREKLHQWLGSKEGQDWQAERQALNSNAEGAATEGAPE